MNIRFLLVVIVLVGMISCSPKHNKIGIEGSRVFIVSTLDQKVDTAFTNMVNHYKLQLDSQMNRVISQSELELTGGKPESLLTNYIADLYMDLGKEYCREQGLRHSVDLSIVNVHGLRASLPKGSIKVRNIFELMPFENQLVIIAMPGDKLLELLNFIASVDGEGIAGMEMGIQDGKAVNVKIGGKPLDPNKTYQVISIDYLLRGGSGMKAFAKNTGVVDMNMKCREAILNYVERSFKNGVRINSKLDGRLYHEQ